MKVVLVTMQLGPGYPHGTERYVESLGRGLCDVGHDVLLLAGDPKSPQERPYGEVRAARGAGGPSPLHHHPVGGWLTVEGPIDEARAWLARVRPDVVHLANPARIGVAAALAADSLGIPVVVTAMDYWWICPRATLLRRGRVACDGTPGWQTCLRCVSADHPRRTLRPLAHVPDALADLSLAVYGAAQLARGGRASERERWKNRRALLADVLGRAGAVIFPSSATRDAIAPAIAHDRVRLVPYGLPPEWFAAPRPRPAATPPPEALIVGYAGSLQPHKGPHLLCEAVRRLGWTRTRVRIAGALDGPPSYGRRLARAARGLDVEFTGLLDPSDMPAFHRSLDVLALTSSWPENLPFSMLEAIASGVTVVGSDVAGVAHGVPDPELRFAPGDPGDLARALEAARTRIASAEAVPPPRVATLAEMTAATLDVYARARDTRGAGRRGP